MSCRKCGGGADGGANLREGALQARLQPLRVAHVDAEGAQPQVNALVGHLEPAREVGAAP
jgi:hypothetical protein